MILYTLPNRRPGLTDRWASLTFSRAPSTQQNDRRCRTLNIDPVESRLEKSRVERFLYRLYVARRGIHFSESIWEGVPLFICAPASGYSETIRLYWSCIIRHYCGTRTPDTERLLLRRLMVEDAGTNVRRPIDFQQEKRWPFFMQIPAGKRCGDL